ncbi:MAG: ABC transporter permease [Armatimonadetes bacterium]|nr:ABC transporter permease [Armatimonadota bacterium]
MRAIWTIARLTVIENIRKQVFQALALVTFALIAASTLLSFFDLGVQVKLLKDLCVVSLLFFGAVMAVALSVSSLTGEVEGKTLYPLLARPVPRASLVLGKYLGVVLTVFAGLSALTGFFLLLLLRYQNGVEAMAGLTVGYIFLETALLAAVGMFLSALASPFLAATLAFMVYLAGSVKIGYLGYMIDQNPSPAAQIPLKLIFHLLPNLESFHFKDALVHGGPVPGDYLASVALYGFLYTAFLLAGTVALFRRKEL